MGTPASHLVEIHVDSEVVDAIVLLLRSHVSGVAIVDTFLRALADLLTISDAEATAADVALRKDIVDKVHSRIGRLKGLMRIGVHNGAVELRGVMTDECQHRALREIISSVPGAHEIHDHLIWIDPTTGAFLGGAVESAASNPPARIFEK